MSRKTLCWVGFYFLFVVGVLYLAPSPASAQVPPDFSFEDTKPMPPVTFSHKFHVTEKKVQCTECHTKIFQMKKGAASKDMNMAKLNEGKFCGNCHNGTRAFSTKDAKSCNRCHAKK